MKTTTLLTTVAAITALFTFTACDVEVTEEGKMPTVDVDVTEGELPEVDVDVAEVKAGLKEVEVEVPKVKMEKETIKVPTVGIEPADAGEKDEEKSE